MAAAVVPGNRNQATNKTWELSLYELHRQPQPATTDETGELSMGMGSGAAISEVWIQGLSHLTNYQDIDPTAEIDTTYFNIILQLHDIIYNMNSKSSKLQIKPIRGKKT